MMILLTGGSGCGKSSFAEKLCMQLPLPRHYIAAMKPYGAGGMEKVARHRRLRAGKGFETFECYTGMESLTLPARADVRDALSGEALGVGAAIPLALRQGEVRVFTFGEAGQETRQARTVP